MLALPQAWAEKHWNYAEAGFVYHNVRTEFFEIRLQPSKLGDHGMDEDARVGFHQLLTARCYLMLFEKRCDEVTHTLIGVFGQRKEPYLRSFDLVAKDQAGIDGCFVTCFLEDVGCDKYRIKVSGSRNGCK